LIVNVSSHDALCWSSAEVEGNGFTIAQSSFYSNGFPQEVFPSGEPWSDGLTVLHCGGGAEIRDNTFLDNTDVDLIVGGITTAGGTCSIHHNFMSHTQQYGFAGIAVSWLEPNSPLFSSHAGIVYSNNTISSSVDMLSFGIVMGFHPWGNPVIGGIPRVVTITNGGVVTNNTTNGAVIGLAIDGIQAGTLTGNTSSNPQGRKGFASCGLSAPLTAGHYGSTADDLAAAIPLVWDREDGIFTGCHVPQD
jgi:hypothetical protein